MGIGGKKLERKNVFYYVPLQRSQGTWGGEDAAGKACRKPHHTIAETQATGVSLIKQRCLISFEFFRET
jgi:hypothetical protein